MHRTPIRWPIQWLPSLLLSGILLALAGDARAQDDDDGGTSEAQATTQALAREEVCREFIGKAGDLATRVATQQKSLDTKQSRIVALEGSLNQTQEELSRLVGMEEKYAELLREREALQVQVEGKEKGLQVAKDEFLGLSSRVNELSDDIDEKSTRIATLRRAGRIDQAQIDALTAEVEVAQEERRGLEAQRLEAEKATKSAEAELVALQDELARFVAEHETVKTNYRNASAELRKYKGVLFSGISAFVLGLGIIAVILFLQVQRRKQAIRKTVVERMYTQKETADALEVMAVWDLIQQDAMLLGIRRLLSLSSAAALLILLLSLGVIVGLIWFGNTEVPTHFIDDLDDAVIGLLAGIGGPVIALALMYQRAQSKFRDSIELCANLGLRQILRDSELKDEMIATICDMPGLDTLQGLDSDDPDGDSGGDGESPRKRLIKHRYSRRGKTEGRPE